MMKHLKFYVMLSLLIPNIAFAKVIDLGQKGNTWPIEEMSALDLMKSRGKEVVEESNKKLKIKFKEYVNNPHKGNIELSKTQKARIFEYDPAITVSEDIKDHEGNVLVSAGTVANPLDYFPFSKELVFFDANDEEQINFVKNLNGYKLIAINGNPENASKILGQQVYFDQYYALVEKFGILAVPATVKQNDRKLLIEEHKL